jgi:hypothetical protein
MKTGSKALIFLILLPGYLLAQTDSLHRMVNHKRLRAVAITGSAVYATGVAGLSAVWYRDIPRQRFAFFNDNAEWKQVDKLGHFCSSVYLSLWTSQAMRWCQVPERKADRIGALTGFLVMLPIEVLDGFSTGYGASTGDLLANAGGAAFFYGQKLLWNELRIYPKFSFHQSDYAHLRPGMLGDGFLQEALKDYNGQTYWLSFDMDKFMTFPRWLNLAIGYGAEGMVFARDEQNRDAGYHPVRQYYLSLDVDLSVIKTRSRVLKTLLGGINLLKFPAPTLEFSEKGIRFFPAYF